MIKLRGYQSRLIDGCAHSLSMGFKRIVGQLATGGGKTIAFSAISERFINKNKKDVLILVHRQELFMNTRKTLYSTCGISAFPIEAKTSTIPRSRVYVGMVETVNNRIKSGKFNLDNIGLVIIDEAHLGNFTKLLDFFPEALTIAFTATPLSAKKTEPMVKYYDDIVCGVDIPELIKLWEITGDQGLLPCHTYSTKDNINRAELTVRGGEFDSKVVGAKMSAKRQLDNTIRWYEDIAKGTKTIVFNSNVEHSKKVTEAFIEAGYNAKHIDADTPKSEREDILRWFKDTPDAILNNVALLTTGFDEPSIKTVIVNKPTKSLPLWLQMTGRGSRPYPGMTFFNIIDLGGNAYVHDDWCVQRDWRNIFFNPPEPRKKEGVAPTKSCPECDRVVHASATKCPECGHEFPINDAKYDTQLLEYVRFTNSMNVGEMIRRNPKKDFAVFFEIPQNLAYSAAQTMGEMNELRASELIDSCQIKIKEWCKLSGKSYSGWHKKTSRIKMIQEIKKNFPTWESELLKEIPSESAVI